MFTHVYIYINIYNMIHILDPYVYAGFDINTHRGSSAGKSAYERRAISCRAGSFDQWRFLPMIIEKKSGKCPCKLFVQTGPIFSHFQAPKVRPLRYM